MTPYPDWFEAMLKAGCPHCDRPFEVAGVESAGVAAGGGEHGQPVVPVLQVMVTCVHCGKRTMMHARREVDEIVELVECHHMVIELDDLVDLLDLEDGADDQHADTEDKTDGGVAEKQVVRPSSRQSMACGRMSDREVRTFLNLLTRTSFKRSSKSFKAFLRRLGIDP